MQGICGGAGGLSHSHDLLRRDLLNAQLTQRAGNFLVAREPIENFTWEDLKGSYVLGGRKGGMPQMVFEYILKKNGIDPKTDLNIDQSISFGLTAAAFTSDDSDYTVE